MYDLTNFSEKDARECGNALGKLAAGSSNMEEVARKIIENLYKELSDSEKNKGCALVRFYKTHDFRELDGELQKFAEGVLGHPPESPDMKCLTLLATAGDKPEWNDRHKSSGHKAIPLPSERFVSQIPMISRLINQFGVDLNAVLRPDPAIIVDLQQKSYNAFHVPEAVGSPYIPAQQDFVIPFGVQSVLGFGGMLSSGDLFAVILFAKAHIPRSTADAFTSVASSVKQAVEPFAQKSVFAKAS